METREEIHCVAVHPSLPLIAYGSVSTTRKSEKSSCSHSRVKVLLHQGFRTLRERSEQQGRNGRR